MAVEYKDYYKLLGVERSAGADEIARAYKKLARKYHPDLNPGNKQAEDKFKDINEAYEVLKDPEKRRMYDQLGPNWQHGQQFQGAPGFENMHFNFNGQNFDGAGFSDFFETLFGGRGSRFGGDPFGGFRQQQPRRGRDVEAELPLTLEEVANVIAAPFWSTIESRPQEERHSSQKRQERIPRGDRGIHFVDTLCQRGRRLRGQE